MDRNNPAWIKQKEAVMSIADDLDRNCYYTENYFYIFVLQCFSPSETLNMEIWESWLVSDSLWVGFSFLDWMLILYLNGINARLLGISEVGYIIVCLVAKPQFQRTWKRRKPHQLVLRVGFVSLFGPKPKSQPWFKATWNPKTTSAWLPW